MEGARPPRLNPECLTIFATLRVVRRPIWVAVWPGSQTYYDVIGCRHGSTVARSMTIYRFFTDLVSLVSLPGCWIWEPG